MSECKCLNSLLTDKHTEWRREDEWVNKGRSGGEKKVIEQKGRGKFAEIILML